MQVSWIDANHLQSLLAQIAPPEEACADAEPIRILEIPTVTGFMDEAAAAPLSPPVPPEAPDTDEDVKTDEAEYHDKPLHNSAAALPLSRIRDKLRAIRQRATEAGILVRVNEPAQAALDSESTVESVVGSALHLEALAEPAARPSMPAYEISRGSRNERLAAFSAWARQVLHENGGHVLVMSDDGEVLWGGEAKAGLVLSTMMAWGAATRASAESACGRPSVVRQTLSSGHVLTVIPCETSSGIYHAVVAAPEGLSNALTTILHDALRDTMSADDVIS